VGENPIPLIFITIFFELSHHSAETRAKISAATKAAMANPEVRRRISERTKAGMAARRADPEAIARDKAAAEAAAEAQAAALTTAWERACTSVRKKFVAALVAELIGGAP